MKNAIILLKPFFSVADLCEMTGSLESTIRNRLNIMEIKPDIQIKGINYYSEHSKNRIIGVCEFEKNYPEIIYHERNMPKEKFEEFESKMNSSKS